MVRVIRLMPLQYAVRFEATLLLFNGHIAINNRGILCFQEMRSKCDQESALETKFEQLCIEHDKLKEEKEIACEDLKT